MIFPFSHRFSYGFSDESNTKEFQASRQPLLSRDKVHTRCDLGHGESVRCGFHGLDVVEYREKAIENLVSCVFFLCFLMV